MSLQLREVSVDLGGKSLFRQLSCPPLRPEEFTVLAGPNGVGKSTLLRAIAQGLSYQGQILFDDQDLRQLRPAARADLLGIMPQNLQSQSDLSVLEAMLVAMNAAGGLGKSAADQCAIAEGLLADLGVTHLAQRRLSGLSGGQRQTVGLAQALARDPAALLLDEPTAALDMAMQHRILSHLSSLARQGKTVIAVLHDLAQAARWADRMIVLHQGQIAADGAPHDVLTPDLLARVYRVRARVEADSRGQLVIAVDGPV